MTDDQSDQLILDMVNRNLEKIAVVFSETHDLIHKVDGDCEDAAFAQMITTKLLFQSTMVDRLPASKLADLDRLFAQAKEDFDHKLATREAEIEKLLESKRDEFIKSILAKIFNVDLDDIEDFEMKIHAINPESPTRH